MAGPDFELESASTADVENDEEQTVDLLGMLRLPPPLITCCDTLWISIITVLLLLDVLSDFGVFIMYAVQQHYIFLIFSVSVFVLAATVTTFVYAAQMRHEAGHSIFAVLGCVFLNLPLQWGILGHHIHVVLTKCATCRSKQFQQTLKSKHESTVQWILIKVDLLHGAVNCAPQMVLNILHMFMYPDTYIPHFVSLFLSFTVLVLSSVMHEKLRKERARNSPYGCLPMMCIILYRAFVFSARIIAFSIFSLYFGLLLLALLVPHFTIVFIFLVFLYRQIWKVPYRKLFLNSVYCILGYFPIHCEYRPEGEIVMYYIIYLLENILMVGLAYIQEPFLPYTQELEPWSDFHKTATALVLLFSSIGLMFMGTYYFFFHGANETISDTSLGWLAKVFEWTKRTRRSPHQIGFYNIPGSTQSSFTNPVCSDNPPLITQPHQPIRENITSPLWDEAPQYHPLYMPHAREGSSDPLMAQATFYKSNRINNTQASDPNNSVNCSCAARPQ